MGGIRDFLTFGLQIPLNTETVLNAFIQGQRAIRLDEVLFEPANFQVLMLLGNAVGFLTWV